jgi:hypothetical protein
MCAASRLFYGNLGRGQRCRGPSYEQTLKAERLQIERKTFLFSLRQNPRGKFLKITEDVAGRRDTVIIPAIGLPEVTRIMGEMERVASEPAPKVD